MVRHLPLAITAVAIVGVAVVNGLTTSRWSGGNSKAETCAGYLQAIPLEIGDWVGEVDSDVSAEILRVAGAVGTPVSRVYRHKGSGKTVSIWLIVGHSSQIVRHTPDVCYPAADFRPEQNVAHYPIEIENGQDAISWTGLFHKQQGPGLDIYRRVFWMWFEPRPGNAVKWEAPGHAVQDARDKYAGAKALFKLYLSANASRAGENPDESDALVFAQEFLPALEELFRGAAEGEPAPPPVEVAGVDTEAEAAVSNEA